MVSENHLSPHPRHNPWNKGRIIGQKRQLKPRDVWTIRVRLQLEGRKRHLALFNLAIDSKLRGCDLVRLQTDDVCVGGRVRDRATVIQKKTGRPVQFEILFIGALFLPLAIQVADIPISDFMPRRSSRGLIILLVFLVLGLMWAAAVAKGLLEPPVRCERHAGVFSKAFSANFDIDRMDCRIPSIKRSPAIHIWNGAPYFGLDWGKVHYWVSHSYFVQLSHTPWKRFVEIGEGTHMVMVEKHRMQLFREVATFLEDSDPLTIDYAHQIARSVDAHGKSSEQ